MKTSYYRRRSAAYRAISVALLLTFAFFLLPSATLPTDARAVTSARVPFLRSLDFSLSSLEQTSGRTLEDRRLNSTLPVLDFSLSRSTAKWLPDNRRLKSTLPVVEQVGAIGMTVSDMDTSVDFYSRVLSFEKVSDVEVAGEDYERLQGVFGLRMRVVRMRLGDELIELTEYLAPKGRPVPVDSRSNDRWFQHIAIITSDMDKAYALLRQNKVEHASTGPQRLPDWNKNAGGIKAFYFRDPDKHWLEILQFPEGKGDAKWQRKERLFLGIDHTAIVVSNTEASLKFYRDVLGLRIAGTSENYGTEQEHLNNVFGARLRITSLRAGSGGPGIEFLEYLAPRDGRPAPSDERASDLFHWQTTLVVNAADTFAQDLLTENFRFVSPGVVTISDGRLGFSKGLLARDPDGHVMALVEK